MKIYKSLIIICGVALAGQCVRYAAYALDLLPNPEPISLVAPYPVGKPTLMNAALDVLPACDGDARQTLIGPCGFDVPVPTEKPRG